MCVLRAYGRRFDADTFAASSKLPIVSVHRRGQPRYPHTQPRGPRHGRSGVNVRVSSASWSNRRKQVREAERFLSKHAAALRRLGRRPGVEDFVLDFPVHLRIGRQIAVQWDRFPASLVQKAARLGLSLEFTIYPPGIRPDRTRPNKRLKLASATK